MSFSNEERSQKKRQKGNKTMTKYSQFPPQNENKNRGQLPIFHFK